ncbi:YidC/Oxa1 family membrane protein insertase [Eubacterium sp. 14-2]|uniref:YidC/Oxa1 family membrane protein insertase n=1 Tax=Eubacterium sp. 14-2 TaxID=1235790 RepID=UPI0003374F6D|nr:YidC/Oxa1 family membrane protein insertase [Eubacterium sp. 14-2]EOT22659.1 YidC/Oxa1 family membrane protein insertase [Eubacterium sp. 14-2]
MTEIILTQYPGKILGPIAKLIGYIMDGLYTFLNSAFGIQNIALCIILFTLILYILMLPLTYKQQKFSRLSQEMQPEINAIREKYKNKKDQVSMQKMNEETQMVYQKYGVSTMGSCVQLLINFPIMLAMYQVVRNIPAYVSSVKAVYTPLVDKIMGVDGYQDIMTSFVKEAGVKTVGLNYENAATTANSIIDVLYALPGQGWEILKDSFTGLTDIISSVEASVTHFNNFLGINIANSPVNLIGTGWENKDFILIIGAILIPLASYGSQVLNIKLMPNASAAGGENDAMARQMKTMNTVLPLFSLFMVFSVPVGVGIYWIAGSVIRFIQQFFLNKYMKNLDLEVIIEKNKEKVKKRKEKQGIYENQIANAARINTRKIAEPVSTEEKEEKIRRTEEYAKTARKGSLLEKANMVKEFNERNNK